MTAVAAHDLDSAISAACDAPYVAKWLLIAEVIFDNGSRGLEILANEDVTAWDRIGMLGVATSRAYARIQGEQR